MATKGRWGLSGLIDISGVVNCGLWVMNGRGNYFLIVFTTYGVVFVLSFVFTCGWEYKVGLMGLFGRNSLRVCASFRWKCNTHFGKMLKVECIMRGLRGFDFL